MPPNDSLLCNDPAPLNRDSPLQAVLNFARVFKDVAPKKEALAKAQAEFAEVQAGLQVRFQILSVSPRAFFISYN